MGPGEQCDNGRQARCTNCQVQAGYTYSTSPSSCSPICGDGIRIAPKLCDNGNSTGCLSNCVSDLGYNCIDNMQTSLCMIICGDGIRASTETCDNGGQIGCRNCTVEAGYSYTWVVGSLSICAWTNSINSDLIDVLNLFKFLISIFNNNKL